MITREQCRGCEDDFYNHAGRSSSGRCWSAESGTMKVRFRLGTWTLPASPRAFTEMEVPSCRREKGFHFYDKLPDFVKAEDVVRMTRERAVSR